MTLRRKGFAQPQFRLRPEGNRPRVRKSDFTSPEAPTVAPYTQEDRIDAGLRTKRIRTVHITLTENEHEKVVIRPLNVFRRFWERVRYER